MREPLTRVVVRRRALAVDVSAHSADLIPNEFRNQILVAGEGLTHHHAFFEGALSDFAAGPLIGREQLPVRVGLGRRRIDPTCDGRRDQHTDRGQPQSS